MTRPARPAEPILHLDMDAFYASVEVRRDPSLAGRPVLVGGSGGRGVVASASYEARAFGVHSAMPILQALRRCPQAVVLPPDFAAYHEVSRQLGALFRSVTPLVEPLALDEAFLDVSGCVRLLGPPERIAAHLRSRIRAELGLPSSVGVAPNKFLAKLCGSKAKPDGLLHLRADAVPAFLAPLPVSDLWGVGEHTATVLARAGLSRVGDLAAVGPSLLARLVGPTTAAHLAALARGHDPRPVVPFDAAKGMSAEETFDRDLEDGPALRAELLHLAERVARRLRQGRLTARTVTLKVRDAGFRTITRSRTLPVPTDQATALHREVVALLDRLALGRTAVRLVGVGATNLVPAAAGRQLRLGESDRWERVERAADAARDRFGDTALTRGALLARKALLTMPGAPTREQVRGREQSRGQER